MPDQSASAPKIKGKWMPVRHTEDQAHPDWVLYWQRDEGIKEAAGQQPVAVAQCERQSNGAWWWTVDTPGDAPGTHIIGTGSEPSADLAMKAAGAYLLERMKEANATDL
jgi:hypothetical protein